MIQSLMKLMLRSLPVAAMGLSVAVISTSSAGASQDEVKAFRIGKVLTMDPEDRVINNALVIVRNGKIEAVGRARDMSIPDGAEVIEQPDAWLVPGLVEAHNHTAGALGDLNDMVYLANPGLRTLETVSPETDNVKVARAGGVTSGLLIPGSGTNISGFGTIVKFGGDTVDEMVMKSPGSLKVAQAGNPERYWWGVGRAFMNYNTRRMLENARDYNAEWLAFERGETDVEPEFNPIYDEFRGLFQREFIASVHTQIYQVVMTTIDMLGDKLGLRAAVVHGTFDAWKTAPLLIEVPEMSVIVGPRQFFLDNYQRKLHGIAARWWQGGVRDLGINTDAPVIPQEELSYQAAMSVWYGWSTYEAIRGVTLIPAKTLMIDDRVGSIEVGKDADFGIWSGDPIDPRSVCRMTVINGRIMSDAVKDRRF